MHIVGRDYTSSTELQKSLGQIGINTGSVLLKLGFRTTETPLEESLQQITSYFESIEVNKSAGAHAEPLSQQASEPATSQPESTESTHNLEPSDQNTAPTPSAPSDDAAPEPSIASEKEEAQDSTTLSPTAAAIPGISTRPVTVFAPPSSAVPQAARAGHNPADFEPTADHARLHQARLASSARNKRLLTDSEIAAQEAAEAQKLASVNGVELKIRYPDGSQVVSRFSVEDTAKDLYAQVRSLMAADGEPFSLSYVGSKGPKVLPKGEEKLIKDLGLIGRVIITFLWDDGASPQARASPSLKSQVAESAKPIEVKDVPSVDVKDDGTNKPKEEASKEKPKSSGGVPKWLKGLPGKKR